jgi:hypothetical protein
MGGPLVGRRKVALPAGLREVSASRGPASTAGRFPPREHDGSGARGDAETAGARPGGPGAGKEAASGGKGAASARGGPWAVPPLGPHSELWARSFLDLGALPRPAAV